MLCVDGFPSPIKVKERTNAAVELFLATKNNMYIDAILQKQNEVMDNIESTAWTMCRLSDNIKNMPFLKAFEMKIHEYAEHLREELTANPFGIHYSMQVWGIGWNVLWSMVEHFFLIKAYPGLFPPDDLYNALQFVLGRHPGSDLTFISGVGSHPPIPAFGFNRSDYAYIPGGVYSGTATILPDFPELKSDHPFLWQQSEYIISGAAPYIFCVLAADKLLND